MVVKPCTGGKRLGRQGRFEVSASVRIMASSWSTRKPLLHRARQECPGGGE